MIESDNKILIIDDSPEDCEHLSDTLLQSPNNYKVTCRHIAADGLAVLREEPFSCVLVDYNMPGHSGLWVIQELRLENINVPVIMLTGNGNERVAVEAMKSGAQEYLPKSDITVGTLTQVIDEAISRKKQELQFLEMAMKDNLTGLASRHTFMRALPKAIARAARTNKLMALMFMDLDRFKQVNDNFGHPMGDIVLREVSRRMLTCIRDCDTLARLGGDEFVLILEELTSDNIQGCVAIATRLIEAVTEEPYTIESEQITLGLSIGISVYPFMTKDKDELISIADKAMYSSKKTGSIFTFGKGATSFGHLNP